jgi:hypothetical protein
MMNDICGINLDFAPIGAWKKISDIIGRATPYPIDLGAFSPYFIISSLFYCTKIRKD